MKYEEYDAPYGGSFIKRENDNGTTSWIPKDKANSDYQQYLRWLNGEPEPITVITGEIHE